MSHFENFILLDAFLMYYQECHYSHSDFVLIEITGLSPCIRKDSKSSAKASDLEYFLILRLLPVISITTVMTVMYHYSVKH